MTAILSRKRLQTFTKQWNHFWFRTGPPHLLAIFRIIFGAFLLVYFGMQLPYITMLYSREGLLIPLIEPSSPFGFLFTPPTPLVAHILFYTYLAALSLFTLGFLTRASGAVAFLLYVYYWIISLFQFATSFDRLFLFTLLILVFSGCGKTFSLDMRLRRRSWTAWEPICILPQRLLAFQITMTYLGVGWQKLFIPAWSTGKVLAYGFLGRWATPPALYIARLNIPLPYYDVTTWMIKAFEITIPFGLWNRRTRWWYFGMGAAFHIGIAVLLLTGPILLLLAVSVSSEWESMREEMVMVQRTGFCSKFCFTWWISSRKRAASS